MDESKKEEIRNYVYEQILQLNKDILDRDNYKKNPYPEQLSLVIQIKGGD